MSGRVAQGSAPSRAPSSRAPDGYSALQLAHPWAGSASRSTECQCVVDSLDFENGFSGPPIIGAIAGPAFDTMAAAMCDAYGRDVTLQGSGG
jgi:hypothetical protein